MTLSQATTKENEHENVKDCDSGRRGALRGDGGVGGERALFERV
jgi:hypothetical protein